MCGLYEKAEKSKKKEKIAKQTRIGSLVSDFI